MKEIILSAKNIVAGYQEHEVLHGVSLEALAGETVLVMGPNGCGKTTLLKVIAGAIKPKQGEVFFKNSELSKVLCDKRARMGIGYLMQNNNIFPSLTVDENLHLSFWRENGRYNERRNFILSIFPSLHPMLDRKAGLLSGGERQALAMGMVLMRNIDVLLLDEPTAGLSPKAAEMILKALYTMQTATSLTTIIVEHNLRLVHKWVSRILVMNQGRIVAEERDSTVLLDHERLQEYYFE